MDKEKLIINPCLMKDVLYHKEMFIRVKTTKKEKTCNKLKRCDTRLSALFTIPPPTSVSCSRLQTPVITRYVLFYLLCMSFVSCVFKIGMQMLE